MNSILAPEATLVIPVCVSLHQQDQSTINKLIKLSHTQEIAVDIDLIMPDNQLLTKKTQKVRLIAPDIGPIIGKTTLAPQLDINKALLKDACIILPITLANTSNHMIDLNQIKYNLTITIKDKKYKHEYLGKDLASDILLYERDSYTAAIKINPAASQRIMRGNAFTCQLDVLSAAGSYSLGKLGQKDLKLTIGPLDQPNALSVKLEKPIVAYDAIMNRYQIKAPISIKNTSLYPMNMIHVFYEFTAQIQGLSQVKHYIKGGELEKQTYLLVGQGANYSISFLVYDLPENYTEAQAKSLLASRSIDAKLVIKTLDKKHSLGTDQFSN